MHLEVFITYTCSFNSPMLAYLNVNKLYDADPREMNKYINQQENRNITNS